SQNCHIRIVRPRPEARSRRSRQVSGREGRAAYIASSQAGLIYSGAYALVGFGEGQCSATLLAPTGRGARHASEARLNGQQLEPASRTSSHLRIEKALPRSSVPPKALSPKPCQLLAEQRPHSNSSSGLPL